MAAAPSPLPECRYCEGKGGRHFYDCPVMKDRRDGSTPAHTDWKK